MASFSKALDWLGFGAADHATAGHSHSGSGHAHGGSGGHGHTHGVVAPSLTTSERGIWAIKWSFVILAVTAVLQLAVVVASHSVALLADTIHNVGDATTAIPLWIAFRLARRKPSATFTYGLGRVEDLAGILIVLIILFSAIVAGYEAVSRLIEPQPVTQLGWLIAAGLVGFLGNEVVAVFRIRVGREMNSAALIADGYHARTDGLTSLAVVLGAVGVWLGYPIADPIIGLLITLAIFGIVWQSARAVLTRSLDGIEPGVVDEIRHAAGHVQGVSGVRDVRARWMGHKLHADLTVAVDPTLYVFEATRVASSVEEALRDHLPMLTDASIRFTQPAGTAGAPSHNHHHHAPEPFRFNGRLGRGELAIVDTPEGERFRLTLDGSAWGISATVLIHRAGNSVEMLPLIHAADDKQRLMSGRAPAEPHEFDAELQLGSGTETETLSFRMTEPDGHRH
ncbi:MAG: cation diffusion facilitator family transporter [Methylobacterium organophilum]|nr:cation diffusion facilitator family transporter [Methylobacterium organophilum]